MRRFSKQLSVVFIVLLCASAVAPAVKAAGPESRTKAFSTGAFDPFIDFINQRVRQGWEDNEVDPSPVASDEEWIRFYSDDGPLDLWGIDVVGESVGDGMAYDVEVHREGHGLRKNGVLSQGEGVHVLGNPFKADTGHFLVRIRPTVVARPWCPLEVRLHSG